MLVIAECIQHHTVLNKHAWHGMFHPHIMDNAALHMPLLLISYYIWLVVSYTLYYTLFLPTSYNTHHGSFLVGIKHLAFVVIGSIVRCELHSLDEFADIA